MKAPGPEDMHVIFYEKFRHIIDKSIYRMVRSFLQMDTYYWKSNKSYISDFKKFSSRQCFAFRPFSLCNDFCKVKSKLPANRL